jgi:hypothetical protein
MPTTVSLAIVFPNLNTELRDEASALRRKLESESRGAEEDGDNAVRCF